MDRNTHTPRVLREKYSFNSKIISLSTIKKLLITNTKPNFETINLEYFKSYPGTKSMFEKYAYYLHFLIMFKTSVEVDQFLQQHYSEYGSYATKIFVNYPLVSFFARNIVTPLICCALWTNDPEMARVLFSWGADFSMIDVNGKYAEELYGSPYINHLHDFIGQQIDSYGFRVKREFVDIAHEILYLASDRKPPQNWVFPNMKLSINS